MKKIEISISSIVKAIIIIIIGLLLIVPKVAFASTGKSNADIVRIRESASTNSEVLGVLDVNDVVEILGQEGDWYKINFKGTIGYVSKSFISTENIENNVNNSQKTENNSVNTNNDENTTNNEDTTNNAGNTTDGDNNTSNNTTPETTQTTTVSRVYKMAENCNVSILPTVTSEQIGQVKKDENVSMIINAGLWAYIKTENISGWVRLDKLSAEEVVNNNGNNQQQTTEPEKNENTNTATQTTFEQKTMYASSAGINVRSQSNTNSDAVDSLAQNAEVKVVGEENGWYKVEVNGKTGFIRKDLLSDKKVEVTSRSNELDRAGAVQNNVQNTAQNEVNNQTENVSNNVQQQVNNVQNSVPASSSGVTGNDIVAYAQQFLGCRYVYGAAGPSSFDCSGLTMYVYKHFGYSLSHSSRVQATQGVSVDINNLQPGDILVFSNDGKNVGHVGIYIGNDKFIHASDSSTGVIISNLHDRWNISKYVGARRIL